MSVIDDCLRNNRAFAADLTEPPPHLPPAKHIAVVVCMDARLNTRAWPTGTLTSFAMPAASSPGTSFAP